MMRIGAVAFAILLALAGCERSDFVAAAQKPFISPERGDLSVTFLGTTSFLIETSRSQIILDGYLSRPGHMLVKPIQPDPTQITKILSAHGVCPAYGNADYCEGSGHKHLDAVLPLHGHYDHAMDSAFVAGWAGARTLSTPSLDHMFRASREFAEAGGYRFAGSVERNISLYDHLGPNAPPLNFGDVSVTLFESPHNENLISRALGPRTMEEFTFPAPIWRMGEDASIAALIDHEGHKLLFMGSAGIVGKRFVGVEAHVVFLSVGGLGYMSSNERAEYWHNVVTTTGARRVFLTHWDNHQRALPDEGVALTPTWFEPHDKVLAHLHMLAAGQVQIYVPATRTKFDPTHHLPKAE